MPEMTLISTLALPEMTDLIEKKFLMYQDFEPKAAEQLYMVSSQPKGMGDSKRMDEIDTETYGKDKGEGEDAKKASVGKGYSKTIYMVRRAIEIDITWEMRNNGKDAEILSKITSLNHYNPERKELDLTHRFTFAAATSYVDMDGNTVDTKGGDNLQVVYAAHTLKFSSTTWRNRVTGDPVFSTGGLELAEQIASTNILNNFGETRDANFNVIFSGKDPATIRAIRKTLESTGDVDEVNPAILNTYTGYRQVVLPKLATDANGAYDSTKRRWWGIVAAGYLQAHYRVWEANNLKTPVAGGNGEDVHNDNRTYGSRMSYASGFVSGRGLVMSMPAS